jgi:predicted transcriptional regulator
MKTDVRHELLARLRTLPLGERTVIPETIADEIGVTRRAVEEQLRKLETEGHIIWHRKRRGGKRRPWHQITINSSIGAANNV